MLGISKSLDTAILGLLTLFLAMVAMVSLHDYATITDDENGYKEYTGYLLDFECKQKNKRLIFNFKLRTKGGLINFNGSVLGKSWPSCNYLGSMINSEEDQVSVLSNNNGFVFAVEYPDKVIISFDEFIKSKKHNALENLMIYFFIGVISFFSFMHRWIGTRKRGRAGSNA